MVKPIPEDPGVILVGMDNQDDKKNLDNSNSGWSENDSVFMPSGVYGDEVEPKQWAKPSLAQLRLVANRARVHLHNMKNAAVTDAERTALLQKFYESTVAVSAAERELRQARQRDMVINFLPIFSDLSKTGQVELKTLKAAYVKVDGSDFGSTLQSLVANGLIEFDGQSVCLTVGGLVTLRDLDLQRNTHTHNP